MVKLESTVRNVIAGVYFLILMTITLLVLFIEPIAFFVDTKSIVISGFVKQNVGQAFSIMGACGLIIGMSLLIPTLRRMYYKLPWLYSAVKIFFLNFIILSIATGILNYGYETKNVRMHIMFFIIMVIQILACRLGMSFYFKFRPISDLEDDK